MSETDLRVVPPQLGRWGDPAKAVALPDAVRAMLDAMGLTSPVAPPVAAADIDLAPSRLSNVVIDDLAEIVGTDHVDAGRPAPLSHTRGASTPDLLRMRSGDVTDAPDAVVGPADHDQVQQVLETCSLRDIAVIPSGGRTSVTGGLVAERGAHRGVVALDLGRLDRLVSLDEVSRTAVLQTGVRGPDAERMLNERGYTLGHFPQSYEAATIGGYAATRSSGQSSAGFGRFDEMVVALTVATPRGTMSLGRAPRSAAGPDLRQLVLGSEGTLGVITSVTVRVRPVPQERVFQAWRFESFDDGVAALRRLAQDGPVPTVLRLSDETETAVNLADPSQALAEGPGGCLAVCGYEGAADDVAHRTAAAGRVLASCGGERLGDEMAEAWRVGRFHGPYLRDPLLDAGALVETMETASFWTDLMRLRAAVTAALSDSLSADGSPPVVLCHVSHVYETGASLYFTVICAQGDDPVTRWRTAKAAASAAIVRTAGTITHHHAVGTDHRTGFDAEVGPLGLELLRAVKQSLDPQGILNPGVLMG